MNPTVADADRIAAMLATLAEQYPCVHCGAGLTEHCCGRVGAAGVHEARVAPLRDAYAAGAAYGVAEAAKAYDVAMVPLLGRAS